MTEEGKRRRRLEAATHTRLANLYLLLLNEADARFIDAAELGGSVSEVKSALLANMTERPDRREALVHGYLQLARVQPGVDDDPDAAELGMQYLLSKLDPPPPPPGIDPAIHARASALARRARQDRDRLRAELRAAGYATELQIVEHQHASAATQGRAPPPGAPPGVKIH